MAHRDAEIAIEQRLRTYWADRTPIFVENLEDTQTENLTSFLQIQFPYSETTRVALGDRHYREEGDFRIVMSVGRGSGMSKIRDWGEELRQLFLDKKFDGVNTRVPSDAFTDDRSDAGAFYVAYIVVPFDYQFRDP